MVDKHNILVGMTLDEARNAGYNVKVMKIDGVGQTVTLEASYGRFYVEVTDGKITKC